MATTQHAGASWDPHTLASTRQPPPFSSPSSPKRDSRVPWPAPSRLQPREGSHVLSMRTKQKGQVPQEEERKAEGHRVHQHQSGECRGKRRRPLNPGIHRTISESHICSGLGNQRMGKLRHTQSCLHCRKQLCALWGQSMRGLEPQCSNFHLRKTGRPLGGKGARGRWEGRVRLFLGCPLACHTQFCMEGPR